MWLLLLMIAIMPYEESPYLLLGENLFGIFAGFTVIKAVGLLGFAWAGLRMASGDRMVHRLGARQATLFFVFLTAVALLSLVHGTRLQYVIGPFIAHAGFLGLVAAGVLFVYRRRGLGAAAAVMLLLVVGVLALPTELSTRAMATLSGDTSQLPTELEASNRAHVGLFWAALRMISDSPILGVGPLNFKDLSTLYTGLEQANMAHNMFLEIAAEMGLPVLAVFVLLLASAFHAFARTTRLRGGPEAVELATWAEGLRSGLTGYVVAGCFISAEYEKILWISIFLSIVVADLARPPRAALAAAGETAADAMH